MNVQYLCPHWGSESLTAEAFLRRVLDSGYQGVEINMPEEAGFIASFMPKLEEIKSEKGHFPFIAQQVLPSARESASEYISRMTKRLSDLIAFEPDFINSHTGKDHFSFDDNCRIIEAAENIAEKSGIGIAHEIHRGRFTFHSASLMPYLEKFPELKLVGDFSHWCTVSESLLQDQEEAIERTIPHIVHIHARVGTEQSPQVNHPFAPEWQAHLDTFMGWWQRIINCRNSLGQSAFTITPEFGPFPYMPAQPFTQMPLYGQWEINSAMKDLLKMKLLC